MVQFNKENVVTLDVVKKEELQKFKRDLQESFYVSLVKTFGPNSNKPIPSDREIEASFNSPGV